MQRVPTSEIKVRTRLGSVGTEIFGVGAQIVTVNDYLARRDSEWVGQVHKFLGLDVGLVQASMEAVDRRKDYAADVTYVTNSELGFGAVSHLDPLKMLDTLPPFLPLALALCLSLMEETQCGADMYLSHLCAD